LRRRVAADRFEAIQDRSAADALVAIGALIAGVFDSPDLISSLDGPMWGIIVRAADLR
jgi:hypothetical protein